MSKKKRKKKPQSPPLPPEEEREEEDVRERALLAFRDFENVVQALLDNEHLVPIGVHYRLSDLEGADAERLRQIWPQISPQRRRALLEELELLLENDYTLSYRAVGLIALDDPTAEVRALGVRLLWEEEDSGLIERLVHLMHTDPDPKVQAEAAGALGQYVYMGEVEELSPQVYADLVQRLLAVVRNPKADAEVRRRALEAVSFSAHEDVPALIETALSEDDEEWQATALFAMGRSGLRRWDATILEYLHHESPRLRAEAATAAGQMGLGRAVNPLLRLLDDPIAEVRLAAAWALGEIGKGGEKVQEALIEAQRLAKDDEEAAMLEDALENFLFQSGLAEEMLLMDIMEQPWEEDIEDLLAAFEDEDAADLDEDF